MTKLVMIQKPQDAAAVASGKLLMSRYVNGVPCEVAYLVCNELETLTAAEVIEDFRVNGLE